MFFGLIGDKICWSDKKKPCQQKLDMLFFKSRGPDFLKQIENGNNTANPKLKSEFCEK